MPCNDISERIIVELDPDDRVIRYTLAKETCGAEVGQLSLLLPLVHTSHVDDIIALDSFGLIDAWAGLSPSDEFLYFKHLFALQETLRVYAGHSHGHQGAKVALAKVSHSTHGIYLSGLVDIQGITEDIRACGNCRSCRDTLPSREQTV